MKNIFAGILLLMTCIGCVDPRITYVPVPALYNCAEDGRIIRGGNVISYHLETEHYKATIHYAACIRLDAYKSIRKTELKPKLQALFKTALEKTLNETPKADIRAAFFSEGRDRETKHNEFQKALKKNASSLLLDFFDQRTKHTRKIIRTRTTCEGESVDHEYEIPRSVIFEIGVILENFEDEDDSQREKSGGKKDGNAECW